MSEVVVLYTTWPDAGTAETAAAEAIAERLCACANIQAPMVSIYRWEGAVERTAETPVLFKTTAAKAHALCAFLTGKHPHKTPCVLAMKTGEEGSHPPFLEWITAETR
ncbi:MAG TPA: divalent-cation tolerance protein CutA [Caulobacteraceae bacterium]|jgi:periplasmic divalent cation tolerance protein